MQSEKSTLTPEGKGLNKGKQQNGGFESAAGSLNETAEGAASTKNAL